MSSNIPKEYLQTIHHRYQTASKSEKMIILNEFCSVCGYHRKYAIRLLSRATPLSSPLSVAKRGPKKKYNHPDILKILKHLWKITNLPCSKRLKVIIPLWLPHYPFYVLESVQERVDSSFLLLK